MISFDLSNLIYTQPIIITDTNHKEFKVKYSTELQKEFQNKTLGIFTDIRTNNKDLFTHTKRNDTLYFPNICIFPCTSVYELGEILSISLEVNPLQLSFEFINNDENITSTIVYNDIYTKYVSIGYSKIHVHIKEMKLAPMTFYENTFFKNYIITGSYINSIIKNVEKQKITKLNVIPNISSMAIKLIYTGKASSSVDISRLFNIHTAGNRFSKIYIQSQKVDMDRMSDREMQYVKVSTEVINPFNGINSIYEACSLYLGEEISSGVILSSIDIYTNGSITINFTSINSQLKYDEIREIITNWEKKGIKQLLLETCIDECVYDTKFSIDDYKPIFGEITSSVIFSDGIVDDINEINTLVNQNIPVVKFPTKTSIQFSMYMFNSMSSIEKYKCLLLNREFLTDNIMQKDFLPTCHAGINISNDVITVSSINATSYEESIYHYIMILGIFTRLKAFDKTLSAIEEGATFKQIQKRTTSINKKQLLKVLYSTDPVMFGERHIGNSKRPYSGLAQKSEQRVVPITASEYEIVKKQQPHSVANVQNQTFKAQRLYLFCPYPKMQYLNFHAIPNQVCIPRCTTKLSNKSQIAYCVNSLDVKDLIIEKGSENQSITLYNPIISRGRKCKLPNELNTIFPTYICLKLNIGLGDLNKYCKEEYDAEPFIIKRDTQTERYEIWTEYSKDEDYVLVLFAERTKDDVFIILDDNEPLLFSKNPVIRDFFSRSAIKSSVQLKFFDFVESITKKPLNDVYAYSVNEIIKYIYEKNNVLLAVSNSTVFGIVYNNKLFFSPRFYWQYNNSKEFIHLSEIATLINSGKITLPDLNDFNQMYITELYIDYKTSKIRGLTYKSVFSFVKATDVSKDIMRVPKIQFDFPSVFKSSISNTANKEVNVELEQKMTKYMRELQYTFLFVYLIVINDTILNDEELVKSDSKDDMLSLFNNEKVKNVQNYRFDKSAFIEFMKKNGFLDKEDKMVFMNDERKFVSWRKSKLSEKSIDDLLSEFSIIDTYTIIQIIYEQLQQTLKINLSKNEKLHSKIIT